MDTRITKRLLKVLNALGVIAGVVGSTTGDGGVGVIAFIAVNNI